MLISEIDLDDHYAGIHQNSMDHMPAPTGLVRKCEGLWQAVQSTFPMHVAVAKIAIAKENYKYCFNNHKAAYAVRWSYEGPNPDGSTHRQNELYRWICNYHGCPFEFHDYIRTRMPPGCYVVKPEF